MRRTLRLLADVNRTTARYLEAGNPTGLTGLFTHNSPRSTLLYLYSSTLDKLKAAPEHSLYRQSVEAITRHRKSIVESVVPPGYDAWAERASKIAAEHPEIFNILSDTEGLANGGRAMKTERDGKLFLVRSLPKEEDQRMAEWDGIPDEGPGEEGVRTTEEREHRKVTFKKISSRDAEGRVKWEPEPQLTADQVSELEHRIGAGLIEEVIQVAEGELKLADTMLESKVWESLEEKPSEGQWKYFERKA